MKQKQPQEAAQHCATKHRQTRRHRSHNYSGIGTYEITVAVNDRLPVFGCVRKDLRGQVVTDPSRLGALVIHQEIPKIQELYPMVKVWRCALMPDHIHLILRIASPLPPGKHLGHIVGGFKGGVTRAWRQLKAQEKSPQSAPAPSRENQSAPVSSASALDSPSLFEKGYNDRILMRDGQLHNWMRYLKENPYRLWIRRQYPHLFKRALCIEISGTRYGAFGNFALLRHPEKHQVFFHRFTDGQPTENTPFWQSEHTRLLALAEQGDVLVTPGISECEKRIKNEALQHHYRLIHLQKEPISALWKPERSRFEACIAGSLLVLAPWTEDIDTSSTYATFHHLNDLAASICQISSADECHIINAKND
ncbi:MAG: hypothetical protein Q4B68_07780 [Bacteroidales bacterium]|nr:hypothetical protein [Bacteroidales bacterium]